MMAKGIEDVQTMLANDVFGHTHSPRKAAGRALGTLVEVITYYLLRSWNLHESISIEIPLSEYGNRKITHNVEYGLHWTEKKYLVNMQDQIKMEPITACAIRNMMLRLHNIDIGEVRTTALLSGGIIKNSCLLNKGSDTRWIANYDRGGDVMVCMQSTCPYMIFECKRVGLDAHHGKGPQAIEKAKQGSYVARTASCLQKIRDSNGNIMGIIHDGGSDYTIKPYRELFHDLIHSRRPMLPGFVATVGIVSKHGNWFTSGNQNKEMMVLAQSYDWLLFLTDRGLTDFVNRVVMSSSHPSTRRAFLGSYAERRKVNRFTKVRMDLEAHRELASYFKANARSIEGWFNVITPAGSCLGDLRDQIRALQSRAEASRA